MYRKFTIALKTAHRLQKYSLELMVLTVGVLLKCSKKLIRNNNFVLFEGEDGNIFKNIQSADFSKQAVLNE